MQADGSMAVEMNTLSGPGNANDSEHTVTDVDAEHLPVVVCWDDGMVHLHWRPLVMQCR